MRPDCQLIWRLDRNGCSLDDPFPFSLLGIGFAGKSVVANREKEAYAPGNSSSGEMLPARRAMV